MSNKIFTLTNFSPIGFKQINYPVQYCTICRGCLVDVCSMCIEKGNEVCNVINTDGSFYHYHCYNLINASSKPKTNVGKHLDYSDSDTDSDPESES